MGGDFILRQPLLKPVDNPLRLRVKGDHLDQFVFRFGNTLRPGSKVHQGPLAPATEFIERVTAAPCEVLSVEEVVVDVMGQVPCELVQEGQGTLVGDRLAAAEPEKEWGATGSPLPRKWLFKKQFWIARG